MFDRMHVRLAPALLFGAAFTAGAPAPAPACDSTGCLLATRGESGLLRKGALQVDLSYRQTSMGTPMRGSSRAREVVRPWADTIRGELWPGFHREEAARERFLQLDAAYGLTSRVVLFASAPLMTDRWYRIAHGSLAPQLYDYSTEGFGDAVVGARVGIMGGMRPLVATFGVKLPTGNSRDLSPGFGLVLDPMGQPGSGATDLLASAQYSWAALGASWSAALSRQQTTQSPLRYEYGDETIASLGAARRVAGPVTASLQVKAFHRARSRFLGRPLDSTGGTTLYLTPGLRAATVAGVSVYAAVPIPFYRYVYENQLGPSATLLVGVSKTFP